LLNLIDIHYFKIILYFSVVDLKVKPGQIYLGEPKTNKADVVLTLDDNDMVALVSFKSIFFKNEELLKKVSITRSLVN